MKHNIRPATPDDYGAFISMWEEFLKEREAAGSVLVVSDPLIAFASDLFFRVAFGRSPGVCLIAPSKGVCLWGPELPWPTKGGKTLIAQGTYVRPDFRQHGVAWALFDEALSQARSLGFDAILSSVDVGNVLSERNAAIKGFEDAQMSKLVSTHGKGT